MKKVLIGIVAALAVASPAAAAPGWKGIVVGRAGGSLAVATPSGVVHMIRSSSHARVGAVVGVTGTRVAVFGRAHHARIRGVIVRRAGSVRFLAAGHALLAVRAKRSLAAVGAGPAPGTVVDEQVDIDDQGNLDEQSSKPVGQAATTSVSATVTSVGAGTITLSVNGQSLTLPLLAGLSLPANVVGSTVSLTLNLDSGGATAEPEENDENDDSDQDGDNGDDNSDNGA